MLLILNFFGAALVYTTSSFARKECDSVCTSNMMFLNQNLLNKWTNTEVNCIYKGNQKEIDDVEMKVFFEFIPVFFFY